MPNSSAGSEALSPTCSSPSPNLTSWRCTETSASPAFSSTSIGNCVSPGELAHYRQVATRLVARFPEIVEPLRDGRLCLTTVIVLARVMSEANRHDVLPRFFHLSRQEAEQVAVEIRPVEVVPRRTVVTGHVGSAASEPATATEVHPDETRVQRLNWHRPGPWSSRSPRAETRLHITVSPKFVKLLAKAKAGQSHVQPNATDEQVLTAALELLLETQEKRKASVPAKVKREVRRRDGGKCQWPLASGGVCGSEVRTEIDHIVPRGRGGPSTTDNCRVLCRPHNLEAARRAYGDEVMDLFAPRDPVAREPCAAYACGGGVTSGPETTGGATATGSGGWGMAIHSAMYRMIPQPPAKTERMKSTRTSASGTANRSARPRQTPAIILPSRARYHSRCIGRWSIQLVQWRQRMAPGSFSVRQ